MMSTHMPHAPGSDGISLIKAPSHSSLKLWYSAVHTCSLHQLSPSATDTASKTIVSPTRCDSLESTPKKRMYPFRSKNDKNSATILHAVPETTVSVAAFLPHHRNTTTHAYQDVSRSQTTLDHLSPMSPLGEDKVSKFRSHRNTSNTSSSRCPVGQLKGAIGVYKHGRIQWQAKESNSKSGNENGHGKNKKRPKIQVTIPRDLERPLPAIPSFTYPSRHHIVTASVENHNVHDVSPPSANSKAVIRNSIVSPLSQSSPMPFGQFQRSVSRVVRRASLRPRRKQKDSGSGSSHDSQESDPESHYSSPSSSTSVEEEIAQAQKEAKKHTYHISVLNPVVAGVFDSSPEEYKKSPYRPPTSPPRRYDHHHLNEHDFIYQPTCSVQSRKTSGNLTRRATFKRKSSKRSIGRRSLTPNSGLIDQAIERSTSKQYSTSLRITSPTLSEAENELKEELTSFFEDSKAVDSCVEDNDKLSSSSEHSPSEWHEVVERKRSDESIGEPRMDSATVEIPPVIPRKSSKRQSATQSRNAQKSPVTQNHNTARVNRGYPHQQLTLTIPENNKMAEEIILPPTRTPVEANRRIITPASAEAVILQIFHSLDHFDDLFATAVANRGFYRVFKRHELDLIKGTVKKMSPPAWEFREIAFPGHDMLHDEELEMTRPVEEYTPSTYLQFLKRDIQIIRAIKSLITEKCQSIVRPEIAVALVSGDSVGTARVDDALWRIWTFCKIFGSGKGREDDIIAQQDWLKGGVMVHQQECTFSNVSTDYMNDTLVGAPECFGKGNKDGLSAEQLFDMMELWNCLGVLLQGFQGSEERTSQAREFGVVDDTDEIDNQARMLDEWCYYLLTFGLSAVLELAGPSQQEGPLGFKFAAQNGWTNWKPPIQGGSRRHFLKEAASRVYDEKIARTYATPSTRTIEREQHKQRIQNHITELRHVRENNTHLPIIRMSQERPMSEWSTVIRNLTRPRPSPPPGFEVPFIPRSHSALAQELTASIAELPASPSPPRSTSPPRRTFAQPLLPTPPPSTAPSTRSRTSTAPSMPPIDEYPIPISSPVPIHPALRNINIDLPTHTHTRQNSTAQHQHPMQHTILSSAAHENTADKAIYRIVEMGFTAEQAKRALRKTDRGDGLRVDAAVEVLLRGY